MPSARCNPCFFPTTLIISDDGRILSSVELGLLDVSDFYCTKAFYWNNFPQNDFPMNWRVLFEYCLFVFYFKKTQIHPLLYISEGDIVLNYIKLLSYIIIMLIKHNVLLKISDSFDHLQGSRTQFGPELVKLHNISQKKANVREKSKTSMQICVTQFCFTPRINHLSDLSCDS